MKYGRNQINKAGDILLTSSNQEEVNSVIEKINDWRMLHLPALDQLQEAIIPIFEQKGIRIHLVSRRLKRLSSIQNKLDRNPEMKLGGLQDIGGLRIVVSTMSVLNKALLLLENHVPANFVLTKDPVNYIIQPKKESGYRSVHFIYKYHSENPDLDGMKVELQLRTKLQHSWAMAVETAELITKTALKSGQGEDEWMDFFKIVSSLFAIKEGTPILIEHSEQDFDKKQLMQKLYLLNKKYNFIDTLKALTISNIHSKKENHKNGYYVLKIDFIQKKVTIKSYPKDKEKDASDFYSYLEKTVEEKKNAVVLVSVPKIQELQDAYPSYFLDTNNFIQIIDTMLNNCERFRWI
ncbi:MAG: RelA/SpoT domain-containing protein [Bacteroidales bacterium]|nr:RelA/SpoT domain-containing protein [Bacteroidales bacterium]